MRVLSAALAVGVLLASACGSIEEEWVGTWEGRKLAGLRADWVDRVELAVAGNGKMRMVKDYNGRPGNPQAYLYEFLSPNRISVRVIYQRTFWYWTLQLDGDRLGIEVDDGSVYELTRVSSEEPVFEW